ncbi:hypothetical protein Terro_0120 [Terriglobus roseus DSM 18391]|uniref:Mannose-6-phosphate isomerase, class I n=1 Tax=Terriglobus roseus (strain DSM 18391 / NRRL B-41598 / KBS 63) TaxID=926566 RepID=I3ZB53_TERRK|nr:hypothetical protein [Terriglobus roseus]AFL86471.1 hypothetical protein Terro_0120 [Terriglobus roseus DSM 18391]
MALDRNKVQQAVEAGNGILKLAPSWVPRSFMIPGRRLKLHPDDIYAYGGSRGGINERWFSSTTKAANGPETSEFEGLSFVVTDSGEQFLLKDAVEVAGDLLLSKEVFDREQGWNILCKFFDNEGPIPHHMHQNDEHASAVGFKGKPEAYYFPPQYNQTFNNFPFTFMGLTPGTTKEQIRECLQKWEQGDNGITFLTSAYRLEPGAGWQINPGILHAPGSLCTYEPQVNSDVFGMFQSEVEGRIVPWELLVKDVPEGKKHDIDYIISMLDWEANVDPNFAANNKVFPIVASTGEGYEEKWIVYGTKFYSAKELTVKPGATVTITDVEAYGLIVVQGYGDFGGTPVSTPSMIRFGDLTEDELFVTAAAAQKGVVIKNPSTTDPLVILKHFGPGNPDAAKLIKEKTGPTSWKK